MGLNPGGFKQEGIGDTTVVDNVSIPFPHRVPIRAKRLMNLFATKYGDIFG